MSCARSTRRSDDVRDDEHGGRQRDEYGERSGDRCPIGAPAPASAPASTVGNMIEPAPPKISRLSTAAPIRAAVEPGRRKPGAPRRPAQRLAAAEQANAMTMTIVPAQENSGSSVISRIHIRANSAERGPEQRGQREPARYGRPRPGEPSGLLAGGGRSWCDHAAGQTFRRPRG